MPRFTPEFKRVLKAAECYLMRQGRGDQQPAFQNRSDPTFICSSAING